MDPCVDRAPTLDGPSSDKSAGIGIEFEASSVKFKKDGCNAADTNQAKGQQAGDRPGDFWQLTADTTDVTAGSLTAEYILNGKTIQIGSGVASVAAAEVAKDIVRPFKHSYPLRRTINVSRQMHGTLTKPCLITNGISKATNAILGQSPSLNRQAVYATWIGLYKSLHPYPLKPSAISSLKRWERRIHLYYLHFGLVGV